MQCDLQGWGLADEIKLLGMGHRSLFLSLQFLVRLNLNMSVARQDAPPKNMEPSNYGWKLGGGGRDE